VVSELPEAGDRAAVLRTNPYLVIDTQFFDAEFKRSILESFDDIDSATDGLLINGDNLQALNLIGASYRRSLKCIYIDPPYNTGSGGFPYKDNYQHSSWLAMMEDRFEAAESLLGEEGAIFVSIDSREQTRLQLLLDETFGPANR